MEVDYKAGTVSQSEIGCWTVKKKYSQDMESEVIEDDIFDALKAIIAHGYGKLAIYISNGKIMAADITTNHKCK